jgi:hypothetical protein
MNEYQPKRGDRIRVTRTRPDGRVGYMVGVVTDTPDRHGFYLREADCHGFIAATAPFEAGMRGWGQVIELMPEVSA